jgi:hypothetical protein
MQKFYFFVGVAWLFVRGHSFSWVSVRGQLGCNKKQPFMAHHARLAREMRSGMVHGQQTQEVLLVELFMSQ